MNMAVITKFAAKKNKLKHSVSLCEIIVT